MLEAQERTSAPRPSATSTPHATPSSSFSAATPPSPGTLGPLLAGPADADAPPRAPPTPGAAAPPQQQVRARPTGPTRLDAPRGCQWRRRSARGRGKISLCPGRGPCTCAPQVMTDVAIMAQANTFILAGATQQGAVLLCAFLGRRWPEARPSLVRLATGTETTANTLSFAIFYIAQVRAFLWACQRRRDAHAPPSPTGEGGQALAALSVHVTPRPALGLATARPNGASQGPCLP